MATVTMRREQQQERSEPPQTGVSARQAIRRSQHSGPTSGLAPGYVQANLAVLPQTLAEDFLRFCQLNPKPCPLIGVSAPGDWRLPTLGDDLDIRTDLPRYRIWRNGALIEQPTDLMRWWRDDLVTFAIGCSFSFEQALIDGGIELRHFTFNCTVPMYRTSLATLPAG
ncbi:MAG: D-glutamate cyclase family protein, partial [Pseudomonadota bacterium]